MADTLPPVLGFAAFSGTGKTTLLRKLIPLLRGQGVRVGVVKQSHHDFDLDVPGKDSYELRRAGAVQTLVASPRRWALIGERDTPVDPDLATLLGRFERRGLDVILVEGFKHTAFPKIELHRMSAGKRWLFPDDRSVVAVATDGPLPIATELPQLDLNDPQEIAGFVTGNFLRRAGKGGVSPELLQDLVDRYRWLRRFGCNDSHSGNASVRDGERFWITPTGACADTLTAAQLIECPLDGECPPGASLDAPLHQRLYRHHPKARAMLHSHGPYTVAATFSGGELTPVDFEGQYYFPRVPVVSIPYEHYVGEAPGVVAGVLTKHRVMVVRGHGVYACGETLNLAYKWTCSLELSAKTLVIARQAGTLGDLAGNLREGE